MRVTAMVLSGWVNKRVVSAFLSAVTHAVGLSGEDDLIRAVRKDGGRLGEVGEVVGVNEMPVRALLSAGILPVVSPVSRGPGGVPLNVNADEAALSMSMALRADRLLLVSDVAGVVRDGRPVPVLTPGTAEALLADAVVTGGMAVKVRQALEAARSGVEVRIGDESLLHHRESGTRVLPADVRGGRSTRAAAPLRRAWGGGA
ncbi:MAG TPA: acetylglutamate kinase, partial [Longimicrobiales bacterium]|nr:acetylglutamate kinase [Longimicrobiales bacterium]